MKNKLLKKICIILIMIMSILVSFQVEASSKEENTEGRIVGFLGEGANARITSSDVVYHIMNKKFYIKNAFSGFYLDVANGEMSAGTNVHQYKYNATAAQRWYISYNDDGTFSFYSEVGNNMVLDIAGGSPNNGANAQIYTANGSDAQKFKIGYTDSSTYVIVSKISNYGKSISTCNSGCELGENVHQYDYAGLWSERWILEPVEKDVDLGAKYAMDNYNNYVMAYPNLTGLGGDCTNFASQAMLASGIHFNDNWIIYRKNANNSNISNVNQLNDSWALTDPSPWISAKEFREYWKNRVTQGAFKATGSEILENPQKIWDNIPITQGCIIQMAKKTLFGELGDSHHTMYVSGYINNGEYSTYAVTYHSVNTQFKSLIDVCRAHPDEYFLFYTLI